MGSKEKKSQAATAMDLQEFIAQTLSAIALAVPAANQAVLETDPKREGDIIFKLSPSVKRTAKSPAPEGQAVQFDIAVQAAPSALPGGAPRLMVPVNRGKGNERGNGLSRVSFEVQVHHAVGEGRKGGGGA